MPNISSLIEHLPEIQQSRLVSSGFGVWLVWKDKLHNAVRNTLRDYGALVIYEESNQGLFFCNNNEVFKALARLQIWARVNPMPVFCEVVPLTFLVGYSMEHAVSISPELDRQDARVPAEFEIVIHPKLKDEVESIPGLSTQVRGAIDGLAPVDWLSLHADQGLDYETERKWFYVIKPLGKMADKEAILGWRDFSTDIVELLQRLGLKYISDVQKGFLFFPLDSFQLLKSFCIEILQLIKNNKDDPEKKYWPVVMAAVMQGDLPFSVDLPKRVGLDWDRLAPDFPHVRFVDGFLLSEWFRMDETRYGTDAVSLDSWCTISLKEGGEQAGSGTMQVMLPSVLVSSEGEPCFYCGQHSHKAVNCPSKFLDRPNSKIWQTIANTDVKEFNVAFDKLQESVSEDSYSDNMADLLTKRDDLASVLARGVYEVNSPAQLRTTKLVWRSRSKEWNEGFKQLAPQEGDYIWEALEYIEKGNPEGAEELIKSAQLKYPRSYQPQCLWGFWHLEMGDYNQALFHWQEAERMSYTPMQKGYFFYLQGRLLEVEGNLKDAINTFKMANQNSPTWIDPVYRQAVCMVKMGFTGQAMDMLGDLISRDPNVFNRVLVDPEIDRGRVQLLGALWEYWAEAEEAVQDTRTRVLELKEDITKRFDENHSYFETANQELDRLESLGKTNNYVAFRQLIYGAEKFQSTLDNEVKREIKRIEANLDYQAERVRTIQKEAAWFPFPKLLLEFNKDFNFCVDKINWIRTQRLKNPDNFRKSLMFVDEIEDHIDSLQKRLVTLRIVRDSTLFVLMLGRNFIWLEILCLGLSLVSVPALIYFTQDVTGNWIIDNIREQRWEVTKGLVIIVSILCLALAAIRSALTFDKRKRELFEQIDEEMRESASRRY